MKKTFLILLSVALTISCAERNEVKIALSKGGGSENYKLYSKWLKSFDSNIEVTDLYGLNYEKAVEILKESDGLVLTGGPDVHPAFFNMAGDSSRCSIDNYRDTLEFELIKQAEKMKLPILAICRGAQIINVARGGSLIIDIPDDTDGEIVHQVDGNDVYHNIVVTEGSLLHSISEILTGTVNSNHHQAVGRLADDFTVSATTSDGLVEAFEYRDKSKPFMIAVQWHPERIEDDSRFSAPIGEKFIKEVKAKKFAKAGM